MLPTQRYVARLGCCLTVALLLSCTAREPLRVGGWITYWDFASGTAVLDRHPGALRDVMFFIAHLDAEGRPVPANPDLPVEPAVSGVAASGGRPWLTIGNDVASGHGIVLKDPQVVHDLLNNHDRRAAHRAAIMAMARKYRMAGVDIDYENLWARDRNAFTAFVRELAADARREGRWADGPGAADWAPLCATVDRLQIMLYNLHSRATGPGPMATGRWITGVLRYANSQCDPERVVPVLKVSGMRWADGTVEGVQYDQAMALVERHGASIARDADDQVPHFSYQADGRSHTVYYEDAVSLRGKLSLIRSLGYRSVVLWSLGRQDPALFPLSAPGEPDAH
jgi:spore germination protein YaaH